MTSRGTVDNIMGELVAIAGRSHPCAPTLGWQRKAIGSWDSDLFGRFLEGARAHLRRPGILDHLMGMTHVRMGHPGMTGRPFYSLPEAHAFKQTIHVSAEATELDDRRTEVRATMQCDEVTTATAEAIFVAC